MSGQGAAIGAATGATYALATGKDPVKYAMIGGAVGGAGPGAASALGLGGTAAAGAGTAGAAAGGAAGSLGASGSALTGAGATGANTMFANAAGVNAGTMINASQAAAPSTFMGASQAAAPGIFAPPSGGYQSLTAGMQQPLTYEQATATGMQRPIGFLESTFNPNIESSSMAPSFMDQVGSGASQLGKYAERNPQLTAMVAQSAQQALQQPQAQMAPAGQINRGQIQPMDYMSLLNPQQSTVLRPQPISLLG